MLEELGDRLLDVHIGCLALFLAGWDESKCTRRPWEVKKLFAGWNMLQKHSIQPVSHNPMRGLRLFVRPIDGADHASVCAFLDTQKGVIPNAVEGSPASRDEGDPSTSLGMTPRVGLLGKLLGEIVAVVAIELTSDALRVDDIVVARDLRKKRIGRVMMREVEQLAAKMDRRRVIVEDARDAGEFFRHVGFRNEGERWVRDVSQ